MPQCEMVGQPSTILNEIQLIKVYVQNLDQAPTSKFQPNISIMTKLKLKESWLNLASESRPRLNFITTTKHQRQNNDQISASKSCLNLKTQSLNLTLWPNFTFQICTKLLSARLSSSTWVTVTTSTSFTSAIKFTKRYGVSEWVSQSVSQLVTSITNDRTRDR